MSGIVFKWIYCLVYSMYSWFCHDLIAIMFVYCHCYVLYFGPVAYITNKLHIIFIVNKYPITKINRLITSSISKSMKGRWFTETFPSIYVPSLLNQFIFCYIMQSILEKRCKILPCFPSKRGLLQCVILFILSTAAAILTQTNLMKSHFCGYFLL